MKTVKVFLVAACVAALAGCGSSESKNQTDNGGSTVVSADSSQILAFTEGADGFQCQTDVKYPIQEGRKNKTLTTWTYPGTGFTIDVPVELVEEVTGNEKYGTQFTHWTGTYTFDDTYAHGDIPWGYYTFSITLEELESPLKVNKEGKALDEATRILADEYGITDADIYVWDIPGADFAFSYRTIGQEHAYDFFEVYKGSQHVTVSWWGDNLFPCDIKELYETVRWN